MVHQGQGRVGIGEMEEGLRDWQATGTQAWSSLYLGLLADARLEAGQVGEARDTLDEAFEAVQQSGERMVEAELHRLRGEMLLAQGENEDAEACFREAVEVARQQQARSWELRAAVDLSRVLQQRGEQKEAHDVLQEIHGWFTEGLNTPDLRHARHLLDRLAGD